MMKTPITIAQKYCPFIEDDIEIVEYRSYPKYDFLVQSGETFRVNGRQCTASIRCNMADVPCSWAGTNPNCDRFDAFD